MVSYRVERERSESRSLLRLESLEIGFQEKNKCDSPCQYLFKLVSYKLLHERRHTAHDDSYPIFYTQYRFYTILL